MKMNKLISIVVPTYNMEKWLRRCLNSFLIQDENIFNLIEVIIVNDGSKDASLSIALEYKEKYPQVFVVIDKLNGNYGSCINAALEIAKGTYFRILDADDFLNKDSLKTLVEYIKSVTNYPDMIITGYQCDIPNKPSKVLKFKQQVEYGEVYPVANFDFKKYNMIFVMHSITYRLNILKEVQLHHLEGISYTDSEYCFYPLYKVKTISFLNIILYRYQLGRDGQTVSDYSYQKNIHHLYLIMDRMLKTWSDIPPQKFIYENQKNIFLHCAFSYYRILLTTKFDNEENIKLIEAKIRNYDTDLYKSLSTFKRYKIIPFGWIWQKFHLKSNNVFFCVIYEMMEYLKHFRAKFMFL